MVTCNETDQVCIFHEVVYTITERPHWVRTLFTTLMIFIFVLGVSGNIVTCIVIYCNRSMHTATNYYLFNLAVSDLIVGFGILLDLNLGLYYSGEYDEYVDIVCRAQFFLIIALWNNSILTMTALAIERYIAIWHPLLLNKRPVWRRVIKIIILIWTLAIIEALPEIWTVHFIRTVSFGVCFIVPTTFARLLNGVLALVTFVIPLLIMIFVYTMVALKVNLTQKNYSRCNIFNYHNNSKKINKLIIALTLSFLICWFPFFLLRVLIVTISWIHTEYLLKYWDLLMMLCSCTSWFNIVLNPLLFSLMSSKFRKAFKTLWDEKIRSLSSTSRPRSYVI